MTPDKLGEKRLYDLLKKRDNKAMEFLYDNYAPVMYGIIMHIVRNEAVAEELMAKTFRYIRKNHAEFDPDRMNACLWIINVTRKICREKVSFQQFTQYNNNEQPLVSALDKSKRSITGQQSSMKSRKVFDLLFFGNGSLADVAKYSGMSEGQVKETVRDAISRFNRIPEKV